MKTYSKKIKSARRGGKSLRNSLAVGAMLAGSFVGAGRVSAQQIGDVFYIAMENHDFTQTGGSVQQIFGNPAASYQNSLVTAGNANAAQTSYALDYYNAGSGVHPSEPNYVWEEAGTDFGNHTDNDPTAGNHNIYTAPHLTGELNAAGVSWKNYQEDVQYSTSPTISASGTGGVHNGNTVTANPYNGSTQYNYAVKHNPMAFFTDTATQNVNPLGQLATDLANNTVGRYNWITPNQYNDAHSALTGGYTYNGVHYTGDQAAVAQGDNFLSIIVPQIMASQAYKNNGAIVIWYDETENTDSTSTTLPEIIISPLAKGNAFQSTVPLSHTSDLQTLQELFGVSTSLGNAIPTSETAATGGYNVDGQVNDLSSLFVPGAVVPAPEMPSGALAAVMALFAVSIAGVRRAKSASKAQA
jgi:hypothetical protein